MIEFVNRYARNYMFSQNGEEGILEECWRRLCGADHSNLWLMKKGHAVEIGAHNGHFCSNTARLLTSGWAGLFVEADYNRYQECKANWETNVPKPLVQCSRVDGQNVNAFVDDSCDVLSVDTDGADFEIFKGLQVNPKIVIVEIDSSIPPDVDGFNSDGGAGYLPMAHLAYVKDYFLLCHIGNLVFVDEHYRHLFPEITGDALVDSALYFNRSWLKAA